MGISLATASASRRNRATNRLVVGEVLGEDLDGDGPLEDAVGRLVDGGHPADRAAWSAVAAAEISVAPRQSPRPLSAGPACSSARRLPAGLAAAGASYNLHRRSLPVRLLTVSRCRSRFRRPLPAGPRAPSAVVVLSSSSGLTWCSSSFELECSGWLRAGCACGARRARALEPVAPGCRRLREGRPSDLTLRCSGRALRGSGARLAATQTPAGGGRLDRVQVGVQLNRVGGWIGAL